MPALLRSSFLQEELSQLRRLQLELCSGSAT
nr:MAG TPA: hypothetical protein [Caudoviricetes sp.]